MRSEGVVGSGVGETLRMKGHACQAQEGPPPPPPLLLAPPPCAPSIGVGQREAQVNHAQQRNLFFFFSQEGADWVEFGSTIWRRFMLFCA